MVAWAGREAGVPPSERQAAPPQSLGPRLLFQAMRASVSAWPNRASQRLTIPVAGGNRLGGASRRRLGPPEPHGLSMPPAPRPIDSPSSSRTHSQGGCPPPQGTVPSPWARPPPPAPAAVAGCRQPRPPPPLAAPRWQMRPPAARPPPGPGRHGRPGRGRGRRARSAPGGLREGGGGEGLCEGGEAPGPRQRSRTAANQFVAPMRSTWRTPGSISAIARPLSAWMV